MPFFRLSDTYKKWLEVGVVLAVLAVGLHLVSERIGYIRLPGGDEGSWMSVAAEMARGEGFFTRWLEYHFLEPYQLPRPDDYRYPGLVVLLAGAFLLFGNSFQTGLWTIASIFLLYCGSLYYVVKLYFGRKCALATLLVTVFSLLQLSWNTRVYSEGLFGLVLACWFIWIKTRNSELKHWWIGCGVFTGLLYLIRPNGVLFVPAILFAFYLRRKELKWSVLIYSLSAFFLIISPWLGRNTIYFDNPFHIAGSAGLMRVEANEPLTYSLLEYLSKYGIIFPLKRILMGLMNFFKFLHDIEHGIEVVPLIGVGIGVILKRPFYNQWMVIGFGITFLACCYSAYVSWAGVRYFSSLLPFVYAYGISGILTLLFKFRWHWGRLSVQYGLYITLLGVLLAPVFYPHRFFERKYRRPSSVSQSVIEAYQNKLSHHVQKSNFYYAGQLCQLNFLTEFNCIAVDDIWGLDWVEKSMDVFKPTIIAFKTNEFESDMGRAVLTEFETVGYQWTLVDSNAISRIVRLSKKVK